MKIVWFKRDLRLHDNEAMHEALSTSGKTLLLYIFEPSVLKDYHYSQRHFDFIKQSLEALQKELLQYHTQILIVRGEAVPVFKKLSELISIKAVYSHQETGIQLTFERDLAVAQFFKEKEIIWNEYVTNGVIRGIKNRKKWKEDWYDYMDKDCLPFHPTPRSFVKYIEMLHLIFVELF
jgi:deoxyribodipyrimidine photo-lyase